MAGAPSPSLALHWLLAGRGALYTLVSVLPSALALVLLPLITRVLTPEAYGVFGLYASIITGVLVCLEYSLIVRKAYLRGAEHSISAVLSGCTIVYAVLAGMIGLCGWAAWGKLSAFIPFSSWWLALAICSALAQAILTLGFNLWQVSVRVKMFCTYKLIFTAIYTVLALWLLFVVGMGWEGMALAVTGASIICAGAGAWHSARVYPLAWEVSRAGLAAVWRDVRGLMPYRAAVALFTYAGPFLVALKAGTEQSGFYLFAFQVGLVLSLGYDSLLGAMLPSLMAVEGSAHAVSKRQKKKLTWLYVLLVAMASGMLALIAPPLMELIFPESYSPAAGLVCWMALGRCFHGINRLVQEKLFFDVNRYTKIGGLSLAVGAGYVWLTMMLVAQLGALGGAIGFAMGHGAWLMVLLVVRRSIVQ